MIRRGEVSSIDTVNRRARVVFRGMDNGVTADIPYADHVSPKVNDAAAVALFSGNLSDGLIVAVWR